MENYDFAPKEKCRFEECEIGSPKCMECEQFMGIDLELDTLKCEIYSELALAIKLDIENGHLKDKIEQLENEIISLKGGL